MIYFEWFMLNKIKFQKSSLFLLVSIFLWGLMSCERINLTKNWLTTNRKYPDIIYLIKFKTICFLNSVTHFVLFRRMLLTLFFFTLKKFCVHSELNMMSVVFWNIVESYFECPFFLLRVLQKDSFRLRADFLGWEKYSSGIKSLGS